MMHNTKLKGTKSNIYMGKKDQMNPQRDYPSNMITPPLGTQSAQDQ